MGIYLIFLSLLNMAIDQEAVLKIPSPSTIIVSGPSGSGKSTLVYKMLRHARGMFEEQPCQIIVCYNIYQNDMYDRLRKDIKIYVLFKDCLRKKTWRHGALEKNTVLILDDLMAKCSSSQDICDLFTIYSHHMNFTVFFLVQNLFANGKQFRTISLNAHQFILFNNQRDLLQIKIFSKQCFPDQTKYFMDAYKRATSSGFGYVFVQIVGWPGTGSLPKAIAPSHHPTNPACPGKLWLG